VSELGALTAEPGFCGTRLLAPVERIARELPRLGGAVAVTMNTAAVMTQIGSYAAPRFAGAPLTPFSEATCLRLYRPAMETTLAVERMPANRLPCSLQFFSETGAVLHKSFLTDVGDDFAFGQLADAWTSSGDTAGPEPRLSPVAAEPTGDCALQIDSIFGDNGLARRAALPDWGANWAWRVSPHLVFDLLVLVSEVRMPLVVAMGNAGAMQVHRGPLEKVRRSGALTVLASGHVTASFEHNEIEEAWVTRIRHEGQSVHVLELYDWRFHCVAMFSALGLPNPGLGSYWEQLLRSLPGPPRIGGAD